ncbi:MAG: trigger factor [Hyphomicrobiaceae bacterium]
MQITETVADGLKREIQVVLAAQELNERCDKRLEEIKDDVHIRGFRKGKVPKVHLRKIYGRRLMLEILQDAVEESSRQALSERNERPAAQPEIALPEDQAEIESVVTGDKDLEFSMKYEVIPPIELVDFATIECEKLVAEVDDSALNDALELVAKRNVSYTPDESAAAEEGDKLKVDFVGKIDGEPFDGGTAEDVEIVIGQGGFIPGFEDGLRGAKGGESRVVTATFPAEYSVDTLKGKDATFDVAVKEVAKPSQPTVDDELAKTLGVDDLEKLTELIKADIANEYERISRTKLKRKLLDALDDRHSFELPSSLVTAEFDAIWAELQRDLEARQTTFEDEGKSEDATRDEYKEIAERRVRLGLVIGEIGERNGIRVEQEELRSAMVEQARRYPGREQEIYEYFEKTPGAVGQLRAPLFEEKVVDYLTNQITLNQRAVSRDELMEPLDPEPGEIVDTADASQNGSPEAT